MKHYDYTEWIFYKERIFSKAKLEKMEEHLYTCNECMSIFLSLIDDKEEKEADKIINIDFIDNIMGSIQKVEYTPIFRKQKQNVKLKDMFVYYMAVASVVVILTLGGFYSGMVSMVPRMNNLTIKNDKLSLTNIVFDISQKIVNNTSDFINNFGLYSCKEESK